MTVQSYFNQQAINMLPIIKAAIQSADSFNANQMECSIIRKCCNSHTPINSMSDRELKDFQEDAIEYYKHQSWIAQ